MSLHRVVAFVHPPQAVFELASAAEVFGLSRPGLPARYEFRVCSLTAGPIRTLDGYDILVTDGIAALERAETIVLPGWQAGAVPAALSAALLAAHSRGVRVIAICAGAFVLAELGLLAGRAATTHWRLADEFRRRFPDVRFEPNVLYVDHGDVATSAGTAAGIDLCLQVVRRDHGAAYAAKIARQMVMPPRREGGQAQYQASDRTRVEGRLAPVLDWAVRHLDRRLTVDDLACRAHLSQRTFVRRFAAEVGVSPGQWLLTQRFDAARQLLEESDLTVDAVAVRVGLSSAFNLRRHFLARLGTTPAAYRRTFGRSGQ
ncbi:helix-turn-helix domain-containing protein [Plantactinospora sp. WMMB782]|uniref:helix-turn-helix domain-containing protein n=1 Tax=Plantactinospora sp. WMMB782 TaxID=3404121 RepID=UPI003B934E89